ncbi:uncharacterized protein LOC143926981 [Lithobates pipiens]
MCFSSPRSFVGSCLVTAQPGEKRIGTYEDTRNPTPPEEGEQLSTQHEDVDSEVQEVGEMVTTTDDVDVVEEENQRNNGVHQDLEKVKENINDVEKKTDQHH